MLALLAAAATKPTVWEKLQAVPKETWITLGVTILVIFALVKVWKSLSQVNEIVPWIVFITIGGAVIMYWTYERKEPKVLSPIFDQLAKILPSKIQYKDADTPK